jgi:hypothetical protein
MIGQHMDLTSIRSSIYSISLGIPNLNTALIYDFCYNQFTPTTSNDFYKQYSFPLNNESLDVSFGSAVFYNYINDKKSVFGVTSLQDEKVVLYYNRETVFNVKNDSYFNGSITVNDSIKGNDLQLSDYSSVLGFNVSCYIFNSSSVFPLEAYSYVDMSNTSYPSVYRGGYLGFFVYPGYKLTICQKENYGGAQTFIDNTTGDTVKKVFWNNQNTSEIIIGSIKIEKNNIVLQDCPYLVNSTSSIIDNGFYTLSYPEPESEPEP